MFSKKEDILDWTEEAVKDYFEPLVDLFKENSRGSSKLKPGVVEETLKFTKRSQKSLELFLSGLGGLNSSPPSKEKLFQESLRVYIALRDCARNGELLEKQCVINLPDWDGVELRFIILGQRKIEANSKEG